MSITPDGAAPGFGFQLRAWLSLRRISMTAACGLEARAVRGRVERENVGLSGNRAVNGTPFRRSRPSEPRVGPAL